MTPTQLPLRATQHLNNGLFADYYLNEVVPELWKNDLTLADRAAKVQVQLRDLRARVHPESLDEAQLEDQWVKPVLRALGHHFSVQVKIRYRETGYRKPDYVFVATQDAEYALTDAIYEPAQIKHAVAIGDAKRWEINLDQTPKGKDERNPSQQIDEYLRYSELTWGILTDGRFWRLYHRDTSKYNRYYAVDLDALLNGDSEPFLYFYAFFRQAALTGDWLTRVLTGSEAYAEKLSDTLEDEVYHALELIAQGFLDYRRNGLTATPDTLREIYEQSLVLLYRLLFIFYAESREVLPLYQNEEYTRRRSLQAIKRTVEQVLKDHSSLNPDSDEIYNRLKYLFFAIDAGDERLGMPAYNGRLFSDKEHPFLAAKAVGDEHLVPALDRMARVDVTEKGGKRRVFVDYRDLEVRHLGSIYEKLLEYELDIAQTALTVRGGKYEPAKDGDKVEKRPGQVYLRTGSNERKVTGSYYTPDYIVRFIVEKTLEPLLSEITARYADKDDQGRWIVREGDQTALRDAILAINVLDPATGSGHFIVDVTAYIAEWLRGLALHPADLGDEDELIYWKRQVASACVYAVDINPLSVELAKLSMWLNTLAKGKPLSFLDHHIRVGNSLVGARLSEISDDPEQEAKRRKGIKRRKAEAAAGQLTFAADGGFTEGVRFAVAQMEQIEGTRAADVSDVKRQEQMYADLRANLSAWETAANVWTARHFGLALTAEQWQIARTLTTEGKSVPAIDRIADQANALAARKDLRFFHWELAFPEVFFDGNGKPLDNPGFDAVVGNPPYVRQERITPIKPYLEEFFEVYSGTADLFLYFYEAALKLVKPSRLISFITAGTYMNTNSAKPFRAYIQQNSAMESVVDFGAVQPFRGVDLATNAMILTLKKATSNRLFRGVVLTGRQAPDSLTNVLSEIGYDCDPAALGGEEWRFQPVEISRLFQKLMRGHSSLAAVVDGNLYRGITTGLNEAFVIDEATRRGIIDADPHSAEIIKPMRRGEDLRPWYQINSNEYLICSELGIEIARYPGVQKHLSQYRDALSQRWEPAHGQCEWYELRPCSYMAEFDKTKIIYPDIARIPRFSWDVGTYLNNTGFMLTSVRLSLLALLQSRLTWFAISQLATPLNIRLGMWRYRLFAQFVERLPIPQLTADQESQLAAHAEQITALAKTRYQLHESMRERIRIDLSGGAKLNEKLSEWWDVSIPDFYDEVRKAFKRPIRVSERDEWGRYFADQQVKHAALTGQIVALETTLNAVVYQAFALTPEEIALIEQTTKYPYGAV